MKLRWFFSRQFRLTSDLWGHASKLRDAQWDILAAEDLQRLDTALRETKAALDAGADDATLAARAGELEQAGEQSLRPYPHAEWRDNVEVLLVAIVIALGIRTFFAQPFKIPTGSMQPTLYGVTVQDRRDDRSFVMPGVLMRVYEFAVHGAIYHQVIAEDDGEFDHAGAVQKVFGVLNKQDLFFRYRNGAAVPVTLWCGPDEIQNGTIEQRLGLVGEFHQPIPFHKGGVILQCVEYTGDHLLVDRVTYNFRRPARGEIVVFETKDVPQLMAGQFYIKRLIGLPGETLSIGDDRHVRVDGVRLDASTPHFGKVYGFDPNKKPHDSQYSGHTLEAQSRLRTSDDKLVVREKHYAVFGDNTVNSSDSRYWKDFPERNLMGRAWFVYWPVSTRFGLAVGK